MICSLLLQSPLIVPLGLYSGRAGRVEELWAALRLGTKPALAKPSNISSVQVRLVWKGSPCIRLSCSLCPAQTHRCKLARQAKEDSVFSGGSTAGSLLFHHHPWLFVIQTSHHRNINTTIEYFIWFFLSFSFLFLFGTWGTRALWIIFKVMMSVKWHYCWEGIFGRFEHQQARASSSLIIWRKSRNLYNRYHGWQLSKLSYYTVMCCVCIMSCFSIGLKLLGQGSTKHPRRWQSGGKSLSSQPMTRETLNIWVTLVWAGSLYLHCGLPALSDYLRTGLHSLYWLWLPDSDIAGYKNGLLFHWLSTCNAVLHYSTKFFNW